MTESAEKNFPAYSHLPYVKLLKNKTDLEMVLAFERTMRRQLGLGDGIREIIVGMTQDEFFGNS